MKTIFTVWHNVMSSGVIGVLSVDKGLHHERMLLHDTDTISQIETKIAHLRAVMDK